MAHWQSPSTIRCRGKSLPSRHLPGAVGDAAGYTDGNDGRFSRVGTIAASVGDRCRNSDLSAGFRLIPNVLPTRQGLPLNAPCSFFNCPLPSSRMLKVALLTRPTQARRDAPFPMRRSRFAQKLNVPTRTPSPLRSLRPCWTVFLSILRAVLLLS